MICGLGRTCITWFKSSRFSLVQIRGVQATYMCRIHPVKLRWNPKWRSLFSWVISRFHINFSGCSYYRIWCELSNHGRKAMILWDMIRYFMFYDKFMRIPFLTNHHRMADVFFGAVGFFSEITTRRIYSPHRPIKSAAFSNLTGSLEIHVSKNPQRTSIWMKQAEDDDYLSICYNPCICHSSMLNFGNIVWFHIISNI